MTIHPAPVNTSGTAEDPALVRLDLSLGGMTCASCAARIEKKLNRLDGVTASVNFATETAAVRYDPATATPEQLVATVEATGYTARLPAPPRTQAVSQDEDPEDAGDELAGAERFGHVVVGADREPDELLDLFAACGEYHHIAVGESSQRPAHLNAVEDRQPEIENHHVRVDLPGLVDGLSAVVGQRHLEAVPLEVTGDQPGQRSFVVDDQDPLAGGAGGRRDLAGFRRRVHARQCRRRGGLGAAWTARLAVSFSEPSPNRCRFRGATPRW